MTDKATYDVFISYSRKDTAIANQVVAALERAGITFFIDRQGIGGGMEFPAVLANAIKHSTIFLFLASRNSYTSKFTQSEIVYAFNKMAKQDIIPYIIDGSTMPDELEFTFSAINWRRIEDHPIDTVLIDDILTKLGRQRRAESRPAQSDTAATGTTTTAGPAPARIVYKPHWLSTIAIKIGYASMELLGASSIVFLLAGEVNRLLCLFLLAFSICGFICLRYISRGSKTAYYALAATLVLLSGIGLLVEGFFGVILFLILLMIPFAIFTLLLRVKHNGHSLFEQLR